VIDRDALDASGRRGELDRAVTELGLSAVQFTHPASRFQFYDMRRLWRDIERALAQNLAVIHLAPPPLAAGDIYAALEGRAMPAGDARVHQEDMRTAHGSLWGHSGGYIADASEVLDGIRDYFAREAA